MPFPIESVFPEWTYICIGLIITLAIQGFEGVRA